MAIAAAISATLAPASAAPSFAATNDERTLSFFHIHTKETLTVTYKRNGTFIPEALTKINWIMRDWRRNEAIAIDPNTIDIIWEMHEELGSKEPVHIICGYRSRGTNEMLRRTVGGQASQSQHMTGKAIDFTFPDIPVKQMRYSAMIRERGGVGYYPTSGIPFIHADTSTVRHWPRMVRTELALIFPQGKSKHNASDGGSLTPRDYDAARKRDPALAAQVAEFFDLRARPKAPTMLASTGPTPEPKPMPSPQAPEPKPAQRPAKTAPPATATAIAQATPPPKVAEPAPKLVIAPKPVERPSRFAAAVPDADRKKLDQLVTLASLDPASPKQTISEAGPKTEKASPSPLNATPRQAAQANPSPLQTDKSTRTNWLTTPNFDDDHPEELTYRPFPLAPLMTETASFDDAALAVMHHPDAAKALDLIAEEGTILPMNLGPGRQTASLLWAQEFRGEAVSLAELAVPPVPIPAQRRVASQTIAP